MGAGKGMNYYERHLGDYARDTAHLSMLEHGAYGLLLDRYYSTEEGIPDAQRHRLARARTDEECAAVDSVLGEFFTLSDGMWTHGRVEGEIAKAHGRIRAAQENGRRGGRPKRTQEKPIGFPLGSISETQTKALHTPDTIQELPTTSGGEPPDPIFGIGLDFLRRKAVPERAARSFLGLLRKEIHDDLTVSELLTEAERQDVSDPCGWLRKAAKSRRSQGPPAGPTSKAGQAIALLEGMKRGQRRTDFDPDAAVALLGVGGSTRG